MYPWEKWQVVPFGSDCMGNCSGYRVQRWKPGAPPEKQVATEQFVTDLYDPEYSHQKMWDAAKALCDKLNEED